MNNPCEHCCEVNPALPVEAFEPRCVQGCDDFDEYCDSVSRDLDMMLTDRGTCSQTKCNMQYQGRCMSKDPPCIRRAK